MESISQLLKPAEWWFVLATGVGTLAYYLYYRIQTTGGSTPTPSTWIVTLSMSGLSGVTYGLMTRDWFSFFLILPMTIFSAFILQYAIAQKKQSFSEICHSMNALGRTTLILAGVGIIIGLFSWNSTLVNVLVQILSFIGLLPTMYGLVTNQESEKPLPWFLAVVTYTLVYHAKQLNYDPAKAYELVLPIVGMTGNGLVVLCIYFKKWRYKN